MLSKGAKLLKRSGKTQAEIAALVGVDRTAVTRWLKGERVPAADARMKLHEKLGVPLDAWGVPTAPAPEPERPKRSHGAVLLSRLEVSGVDLSEAFAVSKSTVSRWTAGELSPSKAQREKAATLGIPIGAWDIPPQHVPAEASTAPRGLLEDVPAVRSRVQQLMLQVDQDPDATPLERAKVLASCAATIAVLAKVTGEFNHGRHFMRLPLWRQIEAAMERALQAFPEAAAALGTEFERLGLEALRNDAA